MCISALAGLICRRGVAKAPHKASSFSAPPHTPSLLSAIAHGIYPLSSYNFFLLISPIFSLASSPLESISDFSSAFAEDRHMNRLTPLALASPLETIYSAPSIECLLCQWDPAPLFVLHSPFRSYKGVCGVHDRSMTGIPPRTTAGVHEVAGLFPPKRTALSAEGHVHIFL